MHLLSRSACLLLMSVSLLACSETSKPVPPPEPGLRQAAVITAKAGVPLEYVSTGQVVSDRRIEVASRVSGYLKKLKVKEGDAVKSGQLLAQIDAADVEGAIKQGQAAVSTAEASLRDVKIDVDRYRQLFDQNSISENDWRKVRLRYDAAVENLKQAQASLNTALAQRDYTSIRSPFDGVVVALNFRAGDLVVPGRAILTLESDAALIFETWVPERQLSNLTIGMPVSLQLDAIRQPLQGEVARIVRSGDPVTRSYPVKISLPADNRLMPGMFGRARFATGENNNILLPRVALTERGGLQGVFVLDAHQTAHFRWLRLGQQWPQKVEVTAGLQAGEQVVASNLPTLRDGDRIEVAAK